jgi:hypothetical protein
VVQDKEERMLKGERKKERGSQSPRILEEDPN